MSAEAHIWAAMADIHHEMKGPEATELRDKLTQVIFSIRRAQMERGKVRTATVNHRRDRLAGIHVVDEDGGNAA